MEKEKNSQSYEQRKEEALEQQKSWGCPAAGHEKKTLGKFQELTLQAVENLTGLPVKSCDTCPRYYSSSEYVNKVVRSREWLKKGQLSVYMPKLPANIVYAIDVLESSCNRQQAHDSKRFAEKMKPKSGNS